MTVTINQVPSSCWDKTCGFEHMEGSTATVISVNPNTGSYRDNTIIVIEGTGFDPIPKHNEVLIGGAPCDVTSATSSELRCAIGPSDAGSHQVIVTVRSKGLALHTPGNVSFTVALGIGDMSFHSGSKAGSALKISDLRMNTNQ